MKIWRFEDSKISRFKDSFRWLKSAVLWLLNDPSWPGNIVKCWRTLSTITITNIKSIQQTKHQKTAQNLFFRTLDHSKMHFRDFWIILSDLVTYPNVGKHLELSKYAISSRFKRSKSRKQPKTSFLAIWIIQKCVFLTFEWSSMRDMIVKLLTSSSTI